MSPPFSLRFDGICRSFAKPDSPQAPIARAASDLIQEVMGDIGYDNIRYGFNDLGFYMTLRAQEGCTKVEIYSIAVTHNNYCMGIKVFYKQSFLNGDVVIVPAHGHLYTDGYYAYSGGRWQSKVIYLDVDGGEYLAQIRTRQGEVTDHITFVTNLRIVSVGGSGGTEEDLPVDLSRRIIAFVGTSHGVLARVGAVYIPHNWETIGHLVLLRALVEKRRAKPLRRTARNLRSNPYAREDTVVQAFIMDSTEDIFKRTLSFLLE